MRLVLSLLFAGSAISAQDSTRRPERLCFRAFDSARCKAYVITEVGYARALNSTTSRLPYKHGGTATKTDFDQTIHAAFGLARNYANRRSLGAAVVFDHVKHDIGFAGVELRYRDWIDTSIVAVE